jgi:hypothetical protein
MITHRSGLVEPVSRSAPPPQEAGQEQERARLRRELLRRIMDRETRRRALRGVPR